MTFQDVQEPPTGEAGRAFQDVLESPPEPEEVGGAGSLLEYVQRTQPSVAVSSSLSSTASAAAATTTGGQEDIKQKDGRRIFSGHTALEVMVSDVVEHLFCTARYRSVRVCENRLGTDMITQTIPEFTGDRALLLYYVWPSRKCAELEHDEVQYLQ